MRRWPPTKDELYKLYWEQGLSTYAIGEMYGVSYEAVRYWLKKYGIPRRPKPQVVEPKLSPSPELAYVLGVIYGDGTVAKSRYVNKRLNKRGYKYVVRLAVIDKQFAEEFMRALEKLGLRPKLYYVVRYPSEKMFGDPAKAKPRWVVHAESKKFYEFVKSLTIEKLEELVRDYEQWFVKGFYESEGCVDISPKEYRIRIVNTNRKLMELLFKMLHRLGFRATLYQQFYEYNGEKRPIYVVQIYGNDQAKRFFELIKPCIKNPFVRNTS